ncbi:DNA gyrase/topoisomerase IV subunit B [Sandaracinus amylolyticus]|uniref:DNA gyrase/topoisomerase IV subunit B n=1 Tax=Sandaracinus amylolyticus TaxID=927083 RepID=UPI001F449833|nr:DNA topoisomerase IV subunit B [Sandaracinus amylolyticus]UJR80744.1 Type IIA DNA topoisomerase subunit B [Sandaracinus amylolyticus]
MASPNVNGKAASVRPPKGGDYTASDLEVLEGLEPVRKRPAMYIGDTAKTGYHHLLWEILDNSVDEAINGHADRIEVVLDADQKGVSVTDNGRGIPLEVHPKFKKTGLEIVLTILHAGGKFEGKNYRVSGGLHGVGASVVNALSENLVAYVRKGGEEFQQTFERGAPTSKLKKNGKTSKRGTQIHFRPDPQIFGKQVFDLDVIKQRLEAKSYLHKGLHVVLKDEKSGERWEFHHPGGIVEYLGKLVAERGQKAIQPAPFTLEREDEPRLELALTWTESPDEKIITFANGIPTGNGGTHEAGTKSALNKAIRAFMAAKKIEPKGVTITAEDIREGVVALVSVYVAEPQFQGQTKDRLNNPEVAGQVEGVVRTALEQWLLSNSSVAENIVARIVLAARAREASRAASQQVSRKTAVSHRLNLPGKLADCSSTDPGTSELFLVEGDSAGGSAKAGRDRKTQAILPLRGKVLNAERANNAAVMGNKELQDIVSALGCGLGKDFDASKLRYGKIFLLMDADSDGHHIATLLLTFFYRMLPGLIRGGHVYIAQPPLYRINAGKETHWALDDADKERILASLPKNIKPVIQRFKGLGEMNADQLKVTTLDPKKRRALRVVIDEELETDRVLNELMGRDASQRFRFIMERAAKADSEALDV